VAVEASRDRLIVPDLGALGFRLIGRLLPADSRPAAWFMYEDGKGNRLSCYYLVVDGAAETEFQFREQNGVSAYYWVDDGLAYAIAANAPRDTLLKIAEVIYRGAKAKASPAPAKAS
jgi:anti-sigma factor RsiW